ncbi:MAG: Nif3-like dinuclear metal center hexameric protein [Bacteroidales bacterium]|nr:Nif3-like dinuclear metal center hexameric protein [Bacteroidales bacterium]
MIRIKDIVDALTEFAPVSWQESYDNSGLQVGHPDRPASGALLTVDVNEEVVSEAVFRNVNLIVAHHPLIFKGLRHLCSATPTERAVELAIRHGIAICACHTNMDKAPHGVSYKMAEKLGLKDITTLLPEEQPTVGLGVMGTMPEACEPAAFAELLKKTFVTPVLRCTAPPENPVRRIALCGGAGSEAWQTAAELGCDALVTADVKYHGFMEAAPSIWLIDIGHYESEQFTKEIFYSIITEKFPNFAVHFSEVNTNPINYL